MSRIGVRGWRRLAESGCRKQVLRSIVADEDGREGMMSMEKCVVSEKMVLEAVAINGDAMEAAS